MEKNGKMKNDTLRRLGNLNEKPRPRRYFMHFLASKNNLPVMELNQFRTHSNPATVAELEQKKSSGLTYANIVRFR